MTITTEHTEHTEPLTTEVAPTTARRPVQRRSHARHRAGGPLAWGATIAGLGAAAALTVAIVTSSDDPTKVDLTRTVAEYGSVAAIDHRDGLVVRGEGPSRTVAEYGSVAAVDHRDGLVVRGEGPSRTVAEHGSVAAIDHRDLRD